MRSSVIIRAARVDDVDEMFRVRAGTSHNAIGPARLAALGITPDSVRAALEAGEIHSWVGVSQAEQVLGFCSVDDNSGEVLVLAVKAGFEGQGLGRGLLGAAVQHLRDVAGAARIWLMAGKDSGGRAYGFYRHQGWRPSGRCDEYGDEELLLEN